MRVLITGSSGLLGRQVAAEYTLRGARVFPLTRKDLDITDHKAVKRVFIDVRPKMVVNCAAYTDVDRAETDREAAFAVNGLGPRLLAAACQRYRATLAHISTDYVFSGKSPRPYLITDPPDPVNVYGASKLMGEQGVRDSGCLYYIVRTSWLFGPGAKNFAGAIIRLAAERSAIRVVDDQRGCPTYTPDLARALADLCATGIFGVYHITNSGAATRYELARKIIEAARLKTKIDPCRSTEFPNRAPRPANSVLDPFPLARIPGCSLPAWQEAVDCFVKEIHRLSDQ